VGLSPLGTPATNWSTIPASGDMMSVEQSVEWELAGETEVLGENLPQCHFVHHKTHMTWPGSNPDRSGEKPMTNHLSYGTAFGQILLRWSDLGWWNMWGMYNYILCHLWISV
jgi:hypothetical protein